jgi:hypothetical protein
MLESESGTVCPTRDATSSNLEDFTHASICVEKVSVVGRLDGGRYDAVGQSG